MVAGVVALMLHGAGLLNAAQWGRKGQPRVSPERSGHPCSTTQNGFRSCFLAESAFRAVFANREVIYSYFKSSQRTENYRSPTKFLRK